MAPVAVKAGVLLAVAAAGSTSVWYFSESIFGSPLVSISDETPAPTYDDKSIGKNYSKYFLSSKKNQKVWQRRFDDNNAKFAGTESTTNSNKAKDKFGTVKTAYSDENNNTTALNKVCEEAYKLTDSNNLVDTEPTSDSTTQFTKSNIWKFCGLGPIFTVADDSNGYGATEFPNTKIGGDTNSKKILVSTKKEENNWFWKIREEEFKKAEGTRSKKQAKGTDTNNNLFAKLKDGTDSRSLSELCEETYKKEDTSDTNKNKTDAELFCSIKLTIPTEGA